MSLNLAFFIGQKGRSEEIRKKNRRQFWLIILLDTESLDVVNRYMKHYGIRYRKPIISRTRVKEVKDFSLYIIWRKVSYETKNNVK
jgi:hypothetical protein